MNAPRQETLAAGTSKSNGSHPESQQTAGPPAGLLALAEDARVIGARLLADASALAAAQWRLTSYVVTGTVMVLVLRVAAVLAGLVFLVAAWVFLNVALWTLAAELTAFAAAPPLALMALNVLAAGLLLLWQKGLRVK